MKIKNIILASLLLAPFYLSAATTTTQRIQSLTSSATPIALPALAVGWITFVCFRHGDLDKFMQQLNRYPIKHIAFLSKRTGIDVLALRNKVKVDNLNNEELGNFYKVQVFNAKYTGIVMSGLTALAVIAIKYGHYKYKEWRTSKKQPATQV